MVSICSSTVNKRSYLYQKLAENRCVTLTFQGCSTVYDGYTNSEAELFVNVSKVSIVTTIQLHQSPEL